MFECSKMIDTYPKQTLFLQTAPSIHFVSSALALLHPPTQTIGSRVSQCCELSVGLIRHPFAGGGGGGDGEERGNKQTEAAEESLTTKKRLLGFAFWHDDDGDDNGDDDYDDDDDGDGDDDDDAVDGAGFRLKPTFHSIWLVYISMSMSICIHKTVILNLYISLIYRYLQT